MPKRGSNLEFRFLNLFELNHFCDLSMRCLHERGVPFRTLIAFSSRDCRIVVGIRLVYYTRNPVKRTVSAFTSPAFLSSSLSSNRTSLLPRPAVVEFLFFILAEAYL